MDRSLNASIIEITRLIKHFNDENAESFTQCLLKQLHCKNQAEYLYHVIKHISCSLSDESVGILRNKAIQLAEKQIFEPKSSQEVKKGANQFDITKSGEKNSTSFSVFQWVQRQYCDSLSRLPSNIIDHMASYLDKKQSVEFGYLNKQLYIESQKQSYLIKRLRCNDPPLTISDKAMDRFWWKQTNSFAYSTPYELTVGTFGVWNSNYNCKNDGVDKVKDGIDDTSMVSEFIPKRALFTSPWFSKALKRVKRITFRWLSCLPHISIPVLFGINNSVNNQSTMIDYMEFSTTGDDKLSFGYVDAFYNKISAQKLSYKSARNIQKLVISQEYQGWGFRGPDHSGAGAKRLLIALGPLSHRISVHNGDFSIDYNEIGKILDANNNLTELDLLGQFDVKIIYPSTKVDNVCRDKPGVQNQLTTITRDFSTLGRMDEGETSKFVEFLKDLNIGGLIPKLKCCNIVCDNSIVNNPNWQWMDAQWDRETNLLLHRSYTKRVLDYLLSIESNTPPSLDKIVLKFDDIASLSALANILLYLIDKRKYFVDSLVRKTKIKTIQIEISAGEQLMGGFNLGDNFEAIKPEKDEFFGFSKNKDYDIETTQVEINLHQFDKKEFGIIYQNVIHWFDRILDAKKSNEHRVIESKTLILRAV